MKKIWIIITMILIVCVGIFTINVFNSKDNKVIKDDLGNTLAVMVSYDQGNNYDIYERKSWPTKEYKYKEAKCFDMNGKAVENVVTFNEETRKATITTNQTISCTLYFDYSLIDKLREDDLNNNISSNLQGELYRYQGTDNISNWICFGTTNKEKCTNGNIGINKYMYRIIGITADGKMKLIKETAILEDNSVFFSYNPRSFLDQSNEYHCLDGKCPEWPYSLIFQRLNGTSNGSVKGIGTIVDGANTDIFVDSEYYDYLKSGDSINGGSKESIWYQIIEEYDWKYGDYNYNDDKNISNNRGLLYNGDYIYNMVSGVNPSPHRVVVDGKVQVESYYWSSYKSKIALMYMYDYNYSYYDGKLESTRGNAGENDIIKDSWIFYKKDGYNANCNGEWLVSRLGLNTTIDSSINTHIIAQDGSHYAYRMYWNETCARPTFYLTNTIQLSGKGTIDNPYIINFN